MKRSEEQMVGMLPIEIRLGEEVYKVKPLGITKQQEWRQKLLDKMQPVVAAFVQDVATSGAMEQGLAQALLESPVIMTEMFFEYAPELPRATILEKASEEQLAVGFQDLLQVVFPFKTPLSTLTAIMMRIAASQR